MRAFSRAWSLPVTWQRWRSHHSIRRSQKPHAVRKHHGSMFYGTGVITDRSLHCEKRVFDLFCSCNLDLDPTTFIYELDLYFLEIYRMCENELPTSRLSKIIVWQTYIHTFVIYFLFFILITFFFSLFSVMLYYSYSWRVYSQADPAVLGWKYLTLY